MLLLRFFLFENFKNTATKCRKWPAPKEGGTRVPRRARGAPCSLGRANGAMVVVVGLCQARLASRTERCVNDAPPTDGRGGVAMGVARGRPAVDAVRLRLPAPGRAGGGEGAKKFTAQSER